MSQKQENPLHSYRSYSYHFLLIACESPSVADEFSSSDSISSDWYVRPEGGPYEPKQIPTLVDGRYVILIDGRIDTNFIIEEVTWGSTYTGMVMSNDSSAPIHSVMTDGEITIVEPRGVDFLNKLTDLMTTLNVEAISMPLMLKLIIVGHKDDGTVETRFDYKPFNFIATDITGSIDHTGTTYKMSIVGIKNGITNSIGYVSMVDGISIDVVKDRNLQFQLNRLAAKINDTYNIERKKAEELTPQLRCMGNVKYNIILDQHTEFLGTLTDFGTNLSNTTMIDGKTHHKLTGTKEGGIDQLIANILYSSTEFVKKAAIGDPPNVSAEDGKNIRYSFKTTTEWSKGEPKFRTGPITRSQNEVIIQQQRERVAAEPNTHYVNVYVSEYKYETIFVDDQQHAGQPELTRPVVADEDRLIFDYIFTGKNIDVLDMNIELFLGLSLFHQLALVKSLPSMAEDLQGGTIVANDQVNPIATPFLTNNPTSTVRCGSPLFTPIQWADAAQKQSMFGPETATATSIWRMFAGFQAIETKLTIHGNPLLFDSIIDSNIPKYVKVNIMMPVPGADNAGTQDLWERMDGGTGQQYYDQFWYDGDYLLLEARNIFKSGMFTQELLLISQPNVASTIGKAVTRKELTPDQKVLFQQIAAAVELGDPFVFRLRPNSTVLSVQPPTQTILTPTRESFVELHWDFALNAATRYGIRDPAFILAVAALESGWGTSPRAVNYNNFFNIKVGSRGINRFWNGTVDGRIFTVEFYGGNWERVPDPFRSYDAPVLSHLDFALLIDSLYPNARNATTIQDFALGLRHGPGGKSYATDPDYGNKIISTYNSILPRIAALNIQPGQYIKGVPTHVIPSNIPPLPPGAEGRIFFANQRPPATGLINQPIAQRQSATTRSVAQAAADQKTRRG